MTEGVKRCRRCGEEKPATLEFFYKKKGGRYGLDAQCSACKRAASTTEDFRQHRRHKYATDGDKIKETLRRYRESNRDRVNEIKRRSYVKNKDSILEKSRQYKLINKEAETERRRSYYQRTKHLRKLYVSENSERIAKRRREHYRRSPEKRLKVADYNERYRREHREKLLACHKRRYRLNQEAHILKTKEWAARNPEKVRTYRRNLRAKRKNAPGYHRKEDIEQIMISQAGRCFYCETDLESAYHVDHFIPLAKGGSNWPENLRISCVSCNLRKNASLPWEWMPERFSPPDQCAAD